MPTTVTTTQKTTTRRRWARTQRVSVSMAIVCITNDCAVQMACIYSHTDDVRVRPPAAGPARATRASCMNWCARGRASASPRRSPSVGSTRASSALLNVVAAQPGDHPAGARRGRRRSTPARWSPRSTRSRQRGLAERRPHPTDRRKRVVHLTPAGERELAATRVIAGRAGEELLAALTPQERDDLHRLLEKLAGLGDGEPAAGGAPSGAAVPAPAEPGAPGRLV